MRSRNINAPLPETGGRPDPNFLNINQVESSGACAGAALSVTFQGNMGKRLKGMAQYTLSRITDDTSGLFALPANNYDLRPELGRADFDQRSRFVYAGTLELPRNFWVGLLLTLASGKPFDISTGLDDNLDTVANDRPPGIKRNTGRGRGWRSWTCDCQSSSARRVPSKASTRIRKNRQVLGSVSMRSMR